MTRVFLTLGTSLLVACALTMSTSLAAEPAASGPKIGFAFTELPPSVEQMRFAFACEDGLEVEGRWIAQDVGKAAPPNFLIGKTNLVTKGPLNLARLTRPTKGWPRGLYRFELVHKQKVIHVEHYVITYRALAK